MSYSLRTLIVYAAARVLPAMAVMVLTFLCIHVLPPERYAIYSLTLLASGVASGFVGAASGQPMLRYSHQLNPTALRRAQIQLPLVVAMLTVPVVLAYLSATSGLSLSAFLAVALIPLFALVDTRRSLFVARGRANAVFAMDAWRSALMLLFGAALLSLWGAQTEAPLAAQLLALIACLVLVRDRADDGTGGAREVDRAYLFYGLGFAGWSAGIVALSLTERSMLANVTGLASSGRYAAQADVVNAVFSAGAGAIASMLMPIYLEQTTRPDAKVRRRLLRFGVLGCLGIVLLCLLIGALLRLFPDVRIAQALIADTPTALMLVAAAAMWAVAGFVQKPVELRGQSSWLFLGVVVALLVFLLIAPALAERFAAMGVAFAKLTAGSTYLLVIWLIARETR